MEWNQLEWNQCLEKGIATLSCIPIVFRNVINAALFFVGVVALVFIIFSGFKFMSSGADPKQVEGARNTLVYALIGLIVVLSSFFVLNFISDITQVGCILTFGLGNCP